MCKAGFLQRLYNLFGSRNVDYAGRQTIAALDGAVPTNFHKSDGLGIARLEADRGAGGNVENVAVRLESVKLELGVGFNKVVVGADLAIVNGCFCGPKCGP